MYQNDPVKAPTGGGRLPHCNLTTPRAGQPV